jgi:hypothetical protein
MAEKQNASGLSIFGFEIKRKKQKDENIKALVPKVDEDGPGYVTAAGAHYGQYVDIDGNNAKDNFQLILKYRGIALHPEVDLAISDIVNEAVVGSDTGFGVTLNMDNCEKASDSIQKKIQTEFDDILNMMKFPDLGHDIFRKWYVDGRLCFQLIVPEGKESGGFTEIRPIDSSKLRKIKNITRKKDPATGVVMVANEEEFFIYQERMAQSNRLIETQQTQGIKITKDAILYSTSGLLDESQKVVISYLHKALKQTNQLRMMEDSLVLYRLARAPERRIFYIDIGNLPKGKAEEYMNGIMSRYRNKLVYDSSTGQIKDDRKHMAMTEDFWLPRREGGRGTEISTLPGGDNLGQIEDIIYFQKKLYKALSVPISRLEPETNFNLGRSNEITRDELKFQKFIDRLRKRFSLMFKEALRRQLLMKNIITEQEWIEWSGDLYFVYDRDNHFAELKEAELLRERLQNMDIMQQYIGEYFSKEWVMKNVLRFDEDEIKSMMDQMSDEMPAHEDMPDDAQPAPAATNAPPKPDEKMEVKQSPKDKPAKE